MVINHLNFWKVCAHWVPEILTEEQSSKCDVCPLKFLTLSRGRCKMLSHIATVDEICTIWVNFNSEQIVIRQKQNKSYRHFNQTLLFCVKHYINWGSQFTANKSTGFGMLAVFYFTTVLSYTVSHAQKQTLATPTWHQATFTSSSTWKGFLPAIILTVGVIWKSPIKNITSDKFLSGVGRKNCALPTSASVMVETVEK